MTDLKLRNIAVFCFLLFAGGFGGCSNKQNQSHLEKLNIIFILIDDLGYTDLSCYGSTFYETPHIDQLAKDGVMFTNAYAASGVCSPTRASILTKYPARLKITDWTGPEEWHVKGELATPAIQEHLPLTEFTIGEAFSQNGYRTGYEGKWHLGGLGYLPENQGFDVQIAAIDAGAPPSYFYPYQNKSWQGLSWPWSYRIYKKMVL